MNQIVSRLYGTARSGLEKERKNAALMQRRIARDLAGSPEFSMGCLEKLADLMADFREEHWERFLGIYIPWLDVWINSYPKSWDKDVLFPMEPAVVRRLYDYILEQWSLKTFPGMVPGFAWILMGSLLRNQVWLLLTVYDSAFDPAGSRSVTDREAADEAEDEDDSADDGVDNSDAEGARSHDLRTGEALWEDLPEDPGYDTADLEDTYESYYYEGDDLDARFPGIDWFCDRCGDYLNEQEGFDDHLPVWKCTHCGYRNCIDIDNISHSEQDYAEGKPPIDAEKFFRALKERTDELDSQ